jgi:hypothetical protein
MITRYRAEQSHSETRRRRMQLGTATSLTAAVLTALYGSPALADCRRSP